MPADLGLVYHVTKHTLRSLPFWEEQLSATDPAREHETDCKKRRYARPRRPRT